MNRWDSDDLGQCFYRSFRIFQMNLYLVILKNWMKFAHILRHCSSKLNDKIFIIGRVTGDNEEHLWILSNFAEIIFRELLKKLQWHAGISKISEDNCLIKLPGNVNALSHSLRSLPLSVSSPHNGRSGFDQPAISHALCWLWCVI